MATEAKEEPGHQNLWQSDRLKGAPPLNVHTPYVPLRKPRNLPLGMAIANPVFVSPQGAKGDNSLIQAPFRYSYVPPLRLKDQFSKELDQFSKEDRPHQKLREGAFLPSYLPQPNSRAPHWSSTHHAEEYRRPLAPDDRAGSETSPSASKLAELMVRENGFRLSGPSSSNLKFPWQRVISRCEAGMGEGTREGSPRSGSWMQDTGLPLRPRHPVPKWPQLSFFSSYPLPPPFWAPTQCFPPTPTSPVSSFPYGPMPLSSHFSHSSCPRMPASACFPLPQLPFPSPAPETTKTPKYMEGME
ncbi:uncharacterized protein LOC103170120 isoform X1 [Ornithorhynchus anatinus]|uniref:uncharacterized protein LOC103170120 isoform X1 n=1 Tax=Ornithorhynchus anatinus TaxID=9258 RepID=UPI000454693B|nr:uncharacterized protein LOC103170120 isoform X1 [Ornithorhynchus anatinus]